MAVRLLPSLCSSMSLHLLDCSSCAILHALQQKHAVLSCNAVAGFTVDVIMGAFVIGGATEALVPFPLLRALDKSFGSSSSGETDAQRWEGWKSLLEDNRLVILTEPCDVPQLMKEFPGCKKLCMCVPSGPLAARMLFKQQYLETFYAENLNPALDALASADGYSWTAWLRSSLTCRYEGLYVPAVRVAETAACLLSSVSSDHNGSSIGGFCCERVVCEEGIPGLTPRWLETVMKTMSSCGVPLGRVTLAFCSDESGAGHRLSKAVEIGVGSLAVSTIPEPLFSHAGELLGVEGVLTFASGWNDAAGGSDVAEYLAQAGDCIEYCETLRLKWEAWMQKHK